jgi:hypothetical protein
MKSTQNPDWSNPSELHIEVLLFQDSGPEKSNLWFSFHGKFTGAVASAESLALKPRKENGMPARTAT